MDQAQNGANVDITETNNSSERNNLDAASVRVQQITTDRSKAREQTAQTAFRTSLREKLSDGMKSASRRLAKAAIPLRRRKGWDLDSQADSPFFRLPPELREEIWHLVLSPKAEAPPAHFHVYGTSVHDSCTCKDTRKRDSNSHTAQVSLPRTCKAIYHEALRFLYEGQKFTIVLCPGLARPSLNLSGRKSLGKASDCKALFARMRSVTLVVQAGNQPALDKYLDLITAFLHAFDYGQNAELLTLHFNFGSRADMDTKTTIMLAFLRIEEYYKTHGSLPTPFITITARLKSIRNLATTQPFYDAHNLLLTGLSFPPNKKCNIVSHTLHRPRAVPALNFPAREMSEDPVGAICLRRGAWGDYNEIYRRHRRATTPRSASTKRDMAIFLALWPVTVPTAIVGLSIDAVRRKVVKGEW